MSSIGPTKCYSDDKFEENGMGEAPEGKKPIGRPRHRRKDNIKTYLQEVGWESLDWIELAQDRDRWMSLVNAAMNLRVPLNAGNFSTS